MHPAIGESKIAEDFVVRSAAALGGEKTESFVEREMVARTQRLGFGFSEREDIQGSYFVGIRVSAGLSNLIPVSVPSL
jgi:hypothetical protein